MDEAFEAHVDGTRSRAVVGRGSCASARLGRIRVVAGVEHQCRSGAGPVAFAAAVVWGSGFAFGSWSGGASRLGVCGARDAVSGALGAGASAGEPGSGKGGSGAGREQGSARSGMPAQAPPAAVNAPGRFSGCLGSRYGVPTPSKGVQAPIKGCLGGSVELLGWGGGQQGVILTNCGLKRSATVE